MPKKSFQDIVPPQKRSIRDIPIPEGRKHIPAADIAPMRREKAVPPPEQETEPAWVPPARNDRDNNLFITDRAKGRRYGLWIVVFVVLLVLAFALSSLFGGATVTVTPRSASAQVSGTFSASRDAADNTVTFDVIKVSRDGSKNVAASAGTAATSAPAIQQRATGTIVIYNNQSSNPQSLVATTRFQTTAGLVFRITKAVTVPGSSIQGGQKVPGSVEAQVTADQPGASYNIALSDFKIPGFKGDPRYDTIYARSKTPMTGGGAVSGSSKVASADALSQVKDEIQYSLKQQLLKDAQSQIPADFTTFDSGLIYQFDDMPNADDGSTSVKVTEHGTLYAVILNKTLLGQRVAERFLPQYSGGAVAIANLPELTFAMASTSAGFDPETGTKFDFSLQGNAKIVWQYNEASLLTDLAGASKRDVDAILAKYPSIQSANVVVRPVWNSSLPKDQAKITIVNAISSGQ